jgi:hypothetical protein
MRRRRRSRRRVAATVTGSLQHRAGNLGASTASFSPISIRPGPFMTAQPLLLGSSSMPAFANLCPPLLEPLRVHEAGKRTNRGLRMTVTSCFPWVLLGAPTEQRRLPVCRNCNFHPVAMAPILQKGTNHRPNGTTITDASKCLLVPTPAAYSRLTAGATVLS